MYSPIVSSSSAVVVPSSSVDAVLSSLATPYSRHRWMPCHLPRLRHALLSWYHTLCCRTYPPQTTQYPSPSHLSNHTPLALLFSFDCCIHHRSVCCLALALFIWHCHGTIAVFYHDALLLPGCHIIVLREGESYFVFVDCHVVLPITTKCDICANTYFSAILEFASISGEGDNKEIIIAYQFIHLSPSFSYLIQCLGLVHFPFRRRVFMSHSLSSGFDLVGQLIR